MRRASGRFLRPLAQAPGVQRDFRVRSGEHVSSRAGADPEIPLDTVARAHELSGQPKPDYSRATEYSTVTTALTTFSTVLVS